MSAGPEPPLSCDLRLNHALAGTLLEPVASSASGHERMVNSRAAASGEDGFDMSAGIVHAVIY